MHDRTSAPMIATAIGSMPGEEFAEAVGIVIGELPDLVHLPELPARGAPAMMVGRGAAILDGLSVDLQPAGWRLTDAPGIDQRRARSLLAQDLDVFEEALQGFEGTLKVQVPGPLTLAATMERPRGDRVLADHGARRELAQSLASGVGHHIGDVRRRVPAAQITVQVDEPSMRAVLDAQVPTASGFGRHRRVDETEADRSLAGVVAAVLEHDALPVLHTCAPNVPIALVAKAGFRALSFDRSLVEAAELDDYARAFDDGLDLWLGVVPSLEPETGVPSDQQLVGEVNSFFAGLGFEEDSYATRVVITPTCGLAGATPTWLRRALNLARSVANATK